MEISVYLGWWIIPVITTLILLLMMRDELKSVNGELFDFSVLAIPVYSLPILASWLIYCLFYIFLGVF